MKKNSYIFKKLHYLAIVFVLALTYSCSKENDKDEHILTTDLEAITFGAKNEYREIEVTTDYNNEDIIVGVGGEGESWCSAKLDETILRIEVADNTKREMRSTFVTLLAGVNGRHIVNVHQEAYKDDAEAAENVVKVKRATATSEVTDTPGKLPRLASYLIDGDKSTYHQSKFGEPVEFPFYYDFYFEGDNIIHYAECTPRQDEGASVFGSIGKIEIWYATKENEELVKYGEFDLEKKKIESSFIIFREPIVNATHIQFKILSAYYDRVSCAEVEFFNTEKIEIHHKEVFADELFTELKPGVTIEQIGNIIDPFYRDIAKALFNGTYPSEYRIQEFRPYQDPSIMASKNKNSKYSTHDNPTGIYIVDTSEPLTVLVGDLKGQAPKLIVRNYKEHGKEVSYSLSKGENIIYSSKPGLVYILNQTKENIPLILRSEEDKKAAAEKTIRMHILTGRVNGLFNIEKHTNKDWAKLLENYATHSEIDVVGRYAHVVWKTNDYRVNNTNMEKITLKIDSIVYNQQEFMGLFHYNRAFNNRAFIVITYKDGVAAAASDYWTYYAPSYYNAFCTEEGFNSRMWVIGHEIGHLNQVRPAMRWAGMIEVTNNIYALYNQEKLFGKATRLYNADCFDAGVKNIIQAEAPLVMPANTANNQHMPKLPPFWQLKLYFINILGKKHFYHDLYEYFRNNNSPAEHGAMQLDFVRRVCQIGEMDMTDFFIKWGFLRPIDETINDYGEKKMLITQSEIDKLISEIKAKKYPEPSIPVHELTDDNYKQYMR